MRGRSGWLMVAVVVFAVGAGVAVGSRLRTHRTVVALQAGAPVPGHVQRSTVSTRGRTRGPVARSSRGRAAAALWGAQATPNPALADATTLQSVSCTSATSCIAVGHWSRYNGSGEGDARLVEQWDGSSWKLQAVPNPPGATGDILSHVSCAAPAACMAGGFYVNGGGAQKPLAEWWNGTSWTVMPLARASVNIQHVDSVSCPAPTTCLATVRGTPNGMVIESWNGKSWTVSRTATDNDGTGGVVSCASSTACIAVGHDSSGYFALQWNGTAWSGTQGIPSSGYAPPATALSCATADFCELVLGTGLKQWDGANWTSPSFAVPGRTAILTDVACATSTACVAVGNYVTGTGVTRPFDVSFDGANWTLSTLPDRAGSSLSRAFGVSCLPSAPVTCTAVGQYQDSNFVTLSWAERRS